MFQDLMEENLYASDMRLSLTILAFRGAEDRVNTLPFAAISIYSSFCSLGSRDISIIVFQDLKSGPAYLPKVDYVLLSAFWFVSVQYQIAISFIECTIALLRHFNFLEFFNSPDLKYDEMTS